MSSSKRWKEFLTWWEQIDSVLRDKACNQWILKELIDDKIREIKRGKKEMYEIML